MLTREAATSIFAEYSGWFGPPALLKKHPAQFDLNPTVLGEQLTYILDGRTRFQALAANGLGSIWTGNRSFFVYSGETIYSTEGRKLLPRMLTLAGHYDRASRVIPEAWAASALDIAAFLNVSLPEAKQVFAEIEIVNMRHYKRRAYLTRTKKYAQYRKLIVRIREGLASRGECGEAFDLRDVANIVGYDGPL